MTFLATKRMELLLQRCHKEALLNSAFRSILLFTCLVNQRQTAISFHEVNVYGFTRSCCSVNVYGFLLLFVSLYPGLWSIGVHLHAVFTGSYVPGHHSLLLINSPNEQAARDIGRSVMERRLAASINILPRTSTMYYWKGEIQDASEILLLVKTKTSRIQEVVDFVRSVHPYANPEVLSFPVEDGSLAYMKWMDEAIPDD